MFVPNYIFSVISEAQRCTLITALQYFSFEEGNVLEHIKRLPVIKQVLYVDIKQLWFRRAQRVFNYLITLAVHKLQV